MKIKNRKAGFTLIELLVVIAIVSLIAAVVMASVSNARKRGRDARRLADIYQIQRGLELYLNIYNQYPPIVDAIEGDCTINLTNWDVGRTTTEGDNAEFIDLLRTSGVMPIVPGDPTDSACASYRYYRYTAGTNGCPASYGPYYVLGISEMETSTGKHPTSPGFSCSGRDWGNYVVEGFEWVMGRFEKQ